MPTYVLSATDGSGRTIEVTCPVADRPMFGEKRVVDGTEFERLPCNESHEHPPLVADNLNFVAHSLPTHDPDFPRTNSVGEGVFVSVNEVRDYVAKKRAQGKDLVYDKFGAT